MSKARFIDRADEICLAERNLVLNKIIALDRQGRAGSAEEHFEVVVREGLAPSQRRKAEAIRDLGAPRGDVTQIEALVAAMLEESDELKADPPSEFEAYAASLSGSLGLARSYGLKECASAQLL